LAERTLGPELTELILQQFGFRAETEVLRADLGIHAFRGEMGAVQFVGVKGGLSLLIDALEKACRAAGVSIRTGTAVTDVRGKGTKVHTLRGNLECDRVILALPVEALRHLPFMRRSAILKHLRMEPLTRIYAKFATPWPHKKLVTNSPLRFIIPIVPEVGLVMISYTEAQDTKTFKGLSGLTLIAALQSELRKLFPRAPTILWASAYEWAHGCTYWLPGSYDPAVESKKALQPFPGEAIHLCNESFSLRQAWIEGSLDHAAALDALIQAGTTV
jgi:glycine/D-amino acid oxidase-like deaminating enzyme